MLKLLRKSRQYFSHALDQKNMLDRRSFFYKKESSQQLYEDDAINYTFKLKLNPGKTYEGLANLDFRVNQLPNNLQSNLFIDFQGKNIKEIYLNSKKLDPSINWQNGRILLDRNDINQGQNRLMINYENNYDSDGSGCVSFIDVDQKQYLYTQFEPFMANRVFPLFDQPDLKAKMKLQIACPSDWKQVISNQFQQTNPQKRSKWFTPCSITEKVLKNYERSIPENYKIIKFKQTKLLSSYLYCFVVGPYKKLICQNTYKNIPMNLYCIQSLFPYLQKLAPFIEQMTNLSMKFFQSYFGYPYPFNKYDQVFAHQYKWGAMENAGLVTLNDLYIFKDPVSNERMLSFGNTIVHQLAHHWFGNLVTMKWWDDLWLNQSFAEYISHFCLQKIKGDVKTLDYESAMASFLSRKSWGYTEDQLITTHPIRSAVPNTDIAESIFDGITYSKGAATMKQLMYLMGQQNFSKSLSEYFHKFAFKNAQLEDLLDSLNTHYSSNKALVTLDEWKQMWLQKQGLNVLEYQLSQEGKLKIKQSNYHENHETLRSHALKIAIFDQPNSYIETQITVLPKNQTIIDLSPKWIQKFNNPQAVLLNHEDLAFAKVVLDLKSIQFFKQNLKNIQNVLLKSLIWKIFFDMVKDAKIKSTEYLQIVLDNIFYEKSDNLLQQNLNCTLIAIQKFTPYKYRHQVLSTIFQAILKELTKNYNNHQKNRRVILRDKLISIASTQNTQNLTILKQWFSDSKQSGELALIQKPNITQSWKIVIKLLSSSKINVNEKRQILQQICAKDKSDTMKNKKITCEVLLVQSHEQLQQIYQSYIHKVDWTMVSYTHSMLGFNNNVHKQQIIKYFQQKYFKTLHKILSLREIPQNTVLNNKEMLQIFIDYMDPIVEDTTENLQNKANQFARIQVQDNQKLSIHLQKKIDSLKKRLKCYQLYV